MRLQLVEKRRQLVATLVDLGQGVRAQARQTEFIGQPIGPIALGRKAFARPRLAQDFVDELALVRPLGARCSQQDLVEKHLRAAQRHVRALIGKHNSGVRAGKATVLGKGLQELESVPHGFGPADLGIAAVGRTVGGGREVAAGRAGRELAARVQIVEIGEAARKTLGHERHHAHLSGQACEQRAQIAHRQRLMRSPERDAVVERIARIGGAVIGDENQQGVAWLQPGLQLDEGAAQLGPGGRPQAVPSEDRVLEGRGVVQKLAYRRSFQQPGSLGLGLTHRQIGGRVAAVAGQNEDVIARHMGAFQQVGELAQVRKVRGEVVLSIPSPVDHQHVQTLRRHWLGRARRRSREHKRHKKERAHHRELNR